MTAWQIMYSLLGTPVPKCTIVRSTVRGGSFA